MTFVKGRFRHTDRLLVVAAHPDDEVLGAGGLIQKALSAGAQVKVVYLTYGDRNLLAGLFHLKKPVLTHRARFQMGHTRKNEALQAMGVLGAKPAALVFLGHPDMGLMKLWRRRRKTVVDELKKILTVFKPTHVLAPADFDTHSDHKAAGYFTHAALQAVIFPDTPRELHYLVHSPRWPRPRKYAPEELLSPPKKWAARRDWFAMKLTSAERKRKAAALLAHESQVSYGRNFLLSFARKNEIFFIAGSGLNNGKEL